jgi:beta-lactam-binding protein with PASTA domain
VGDYRSQTLEVATTNIDVDEFSLGEVVASSSGTYDNSWIVVDQSPSPGTKADVGAPIDLTVGDPADPATSAICP